MNTAQAHFKPVPCARKPDPWPKVFGFHEIFHCGTVAGYACHMVVIYMVIVQLWP